MRNHRDELSPNVVDNVDRGLSYSLSDVAEAHLQQTQIARRWLDLFKEIDVVICPATSTTPFNHDHWTITEIDGGANGKPTCAGWPLLIYQPWHLRAVL